MKLVYIYTFLEKIWIISYTKVEYYNKLYLLTDKSRYKHCRIFWSKISEWVLNKQMESIRNH